MNSEDLSMCFATGRQVARAVVAVTLVVLLAAADAGTTQILVTSFDDGAGNRGVRRLQLGGPTDGASLGSFISGAAPSTGAWRRISPRRIRKRVSARGVSSPSIRRSDMGRTC